MSSSDTWWLNLTNAVMGGGVALCFLAIAVAAVWSALKRARTHSPRRKAAGI